ncbi:MAG: hypothetical protein ABSD59_25830 [Terracidiphilus sp.]
MGSLVVHALAAVVIWFALAYKPPSSRVVTENAIVRELELRAMAEEMAQVNARIPYPKPQPHRNASASAPKSEPAPPKIQAKLSPQTLIQPDIPNPVTLSQQIPVPRVMIWSPSKVVVKHITPPLLKKPVAADVVPNLDRPNQEIKLADVNISSGFKPSPKSLNTPSTTSPIAIRDSMQVQQAPSSVSQIAGAPTPAAILSLSDLHLQDGTAALPPVSGAQKSNSQAGLGSGQGQNPSAQSGNGNSAGKIEAGSTGPGAAIAIGTSGQFTSTPIAMPKDGHFGSVTVGEALAQEFPEITDVWGTRAAYTAHLRVGLAKSWILQYSLPRGAGATAASRLEAPWPYDIVRPNLAPGSIGGDALMIHGFVNSSGRFEDLSVVFPQPFSSAQFVLAALQKWQFRPATQNGQAAKVEVLLIIPDIEE